MGGCGTANVISYNIQSRMSSTSASCRFVFHEKKCQVSEMCNLRGSNDDS